MTGNILAPMTCAALVRIVYAGELSTTSLADCGTVTRTFAIRAPRPTRAPEPGPWNEDPEERRKPNQPFYRSVPHKRGRRRK